MLVDLFRLSNGIRGQATLDELRVADGVGPDLMSLHQVQGFHGPGEVSAIATPGEVV